MPKKLGFVGAGEGPQASTTTMTIVALYRSERNLLASVVIYVPGFQLVTKYLFSGLL